MAFDLKKQLQRGKNTVATKFAAVAVKADEIKDEAVIQVTRAARKVKAQLPELKFLRKK